MCAFTNHITSDELEARWRRCRGLLSREAPDAGGLMVFSRLNIYYLSGTMARGVLWLPIEGPPVLLCRRGQARANLESPLEIILPYHSFSELPALLREGGSALPQKIAAEMSGLPWSLSVSLNRHLSSHEFIPCDRLLALSRSIKSKWELERLRIAGNRHATCLQSLLPPFLSPGMTEREIAHLVWEVFFGQGHQGILRTQNAGEEIFLGHVSAGESANYPSFFNGPVGLRGEHPAVPHMGSASVQWHEGEPLTIDVGFGFEGYHTDKTQIYWAGEPGSIPDRILSAHRFCIDIQKMIAKELQPGSIPAHLSDKTFALAREHGWEDGFMALGSNKVPFVGHGVGLAIDEFPVLAAGFDAPLETGMVLAVEPKIGIPGVGMVGVENTFEVTAEGGRCLTGHDFDIKYIPSR